MGIKCHVCKALSTNSWHILGARKTQTVIGAIETMFIQEVKATAEVEDFRACFPILFIFILELPVIVENRFDVMCLFNKFFCLFCTPFQIFRRTKSIYCLELESWFFVVFIVFGGGI